MPVKTKPPKKKASSKSQPDAAGSLKGWTAIAHYLGIPVATAHRWASEGMPIGREGRFTVADREAVSAWLGRESRRSVSPACGANNGTNGLRQPARTDH